VCANKLFYLAVPPEHYRTILERLAGSGLTEPCSDLEGWTRVLVEKPFGDDERLAGARRVPRQPLPRGADLPHRPLPRQRDAPGHHELPVHQQPLRDFVGAADAIESIDISLLESIGVEKRGRFYDGVGALRDVGQNHLLQMLALVTMDQPPAGGPPPSARRGRRSSCDRLRPPTAEEGRARELPRAVRRLPRHRGRGPGFGHRDLLPAALRADRQQVGRVPVTLPGGQAPRRPRKEIVVTFRHPHPCLCDIGQHYQNRVVFKLEPTESIEIVSGPRSPGSTTRSSERTFDFFLYEKAEKAQYVEEYAKLLLDAIDGDQTLFVSTDEVAAMWAFIDPVFRAWHEGAVPLETYAPDSAEVVERAAEVVAQPAVAGQRGCRRGSARWARVSHSTSPTTAGRWSGTTARRRR
jgi:glucose-6-phosphate 1-dehydrogenase